MHDAKWKLRINVDNEKSLLIEPTDAGRFAPGDRPVVVKEPAVESAFVAKLERGGVTRIRPEVTTMVHFYNQDERKAREDGFMEMETGRGNTLLEGRDLIPIEQVENEKGSCWLVSTKDSYDDLIYGIIPTKDLLGSE